ncbi:MAG: hypothetical protein IKC94_00160 [Lentisphaeria bacterium]|nr:hypothetical protein [Lentisphaeria bacterium]
MMKTIKILTVMLLLISGISSYASGSMCQRDQRSGALNIDNGYFSFTLFPGHMFPVWIKNAGGTGLPPCRFLDRITFLKGGPAYFLDMDLYAETVILADTPERLLIEKRGTYCDNPQHAAPGNIRVTYAYLIERGKPYVTLTMTLARDNEEPAEVRFFHPAWSGATPWHEVIMPEDKNFAVGRGDGVTDEMYGPVQHLSLKNDSLTLQVSGVVRFFCNRFNRNSFLLGGIKDVWKSRELTMQVTFTVK